VGRERQFPERPLRFYGAERAITLLLPPPPPASASAREPWRPRSDGDLLAAHLRALDLWHEFMSQPAAIVPGQSREARLDEARRRDVAEREREAMYAWADAALRKPSGLGLGAVPRVVIAHRHEWLRDKVQLAFCQHDVEVVAAVGDGAEAAAAIVMEQPDLVFLEDLLPSLSGLELIERTRLFAPGALVGAHALGQSGMPPLLEAGARAAFSRRIPPAEIAAELVAYLHGRHADLVTMV
jgi:CheY-like chemotaxis protein